MRSTDFTYSDEAIPQMLATPSTPSCGRSRRPATGATAAATDKRSLPPVEFEYTAARSCRTQCEEVDPESLENLPIGLDGSAYQWTDLHGEGIPGILTEQAGAWFYKRNLSPIPAELPDGAKSVKARFAPLETVATQAQPRPERRRGSSWTWPATASPTWSSWTARCPASTSTTRPRAGSRSAPSPRASTATCATPT